MAQQIIQANLIFNFVLTFAYWSVSLQKVGLEVNFKQITSNSFNCVIYREDMNPLSIFHIRAWLNAEENVKT